MMVDKHHSLGFEATRLIQILSNPDGLDFVNVLGPIPEKKDLALPDGWAVRIIRIESAWEVDLPAPTETYWFEGPISHQGPVEVPASAKTIIDRRR